MTDKIRYFLEAWEMNGVGKTIATVQDSPGTVVTITVDDLKAALESRVLAERKEPRLWVMFGENGRVLAYSSVEPTNSGFTYTPLFTHPTPDDASQWQPIETAPTDETTILVWGTLHSMLMANSAAYPARYSRGWWLHKGNAVLSHVTHWMPLPKPPAAIDRAMQDKEPK